MGSSSWRFAHGVEFSPHVVLFIRDALQLRGASAPAAPPALDGEIPDRSGLLAPSDRERAAVEWGRWWTAVVDFESRWHLDEEGAGPSKYEQVVEYGRMVDPSSSPVLRESVLRPAATALFKAACQWAQTAAGPVCGTCAADEGTLLEWSEIRAAAECVARERGVEPGALAGAASVLRVTDVWWDLARPRFVLCSERAAADPALTRAMARSAFESALAA